MMFYGHAGADEMHDMGVEFRNHWLQATTQHLLASVRVHATAVSPSNGMTMLQDTHAPPN